MKAFAIEAYDAPDAVEYLQVADSLVVNDMVAWVVPAARVPVGRAELLVGAVVSGAADVFAEIILDNVATLPASSVALMAK